MKKTKQRFAFRFAVKACLLLLIAIATPALIRAQDAIESAAQTASSGATASSVKTPALPTSIPQKTNAHLIAFGGPPPDEVNRRVLQAKAGKDGSKLLMRSSPNGAQVYMNQKFVGHTPLLLIVPPGKYRIEMRGQRGESAEKTIGILAHETQEVTIKLPPLYPTRVTLK